MPIPVAIVQDVLISAYNNGCDMVMSSWQSTKVTAAALEWYRNRSAKLNMAGYISEVYSSFFYVSIQ